MGAKPLVVIGLLGTQLDAGKNSERWERWRPTVSLFQHDDLVIDRLELLYQPESVALTEQVIADARALSPESSFSRHALPIRDPWDFQEVYEALDRFARGYPFRPEEEEYLLHITTGTHVAQICLFLLTESRYLPGRLIQTSPPVRGAPGPSYEIIDLDLSKYDRLAARFQRERAEGLSFLKGGIDTKNAAFNRMIERIEEVAGRSRLPIVLSGPTGAGKSQLAKKIHELKRQRRLTAGELVEVNCATLRGDAAMSTLFGHKKGAFTGALQDRAGLLRRADGGVLFLDEIGELGLDEQAMLLLALEEKRFYPVGSDQEVRSEFQLLAGTNRDLRERVRAGRFREDLLARIDLWSFTLPGLRERPEDIEPNLDYELTRAASQLGHQVTLNKEARARFLSFAVRPEARWRGNFRDLGAAVTRMATLAPGGRIRREEVEEEIERLLRAWDDGSAPTTSPLDGLLSPEEQGALDRFDRVQLEDVVRVCRAARSLSDAGRALFAASRAQKKSSNDADRLRKYLARFGLSFEQIHGPTEDLAASPSPARGGAVSSPACDEKTKSGP